MKAAEDDAWYETPRGRRFGDAEYALLCGMLAAGPGETLLDAGCGTGNFTRRFARDAGLAAMGIDINRDWVSFARQRVCYSQLVPVLVEYTQDRRQVQA